MAAVAAGTPTGSLAAVALPQDKARSLEKPSRLTEDTGVQPLRQTVAAKTMPGLPDRHLRGQVWGEDSRPGRPDTAFIQTTRSLSPPSLRACPVFFIEAGVTPPRGRPVRVTDTRTCRRNPGELPASVRLFFTPSRKTPPGRHIPEENQQPERQKPR